ncbi:unnamed protein product, partial [Polarella glacialis]
MPAALSLGNPQHFERFAEEARRLVHQHCTLQAEAKAAFVRGRLTERTVSQLSELVALRNQLAPFARDVDMSCSAEEDSLLHRPLEPWSADEQKAMKAIVQERVLQLLSKHRRVDDACDDEASDSDVEEDVKQGLQQLRQVAQATAAPKVVAPKVELPQVDPALQAELQRRRRELEDLLRQIAKWRTRAD